MSPAKKVAENMVINYRASSYMYILFQTILTFNAKTL